MARLPCSALWTVRLTTTALDMRLWLVFQQRYWVIRMLQVRFQVGRGATGEPLDVRVLHDRFVEVDGDRIDHGLLTGLINEEKTVEGNVTTFTTTVKF